jgi:low affinity Fe/Cu permease
VVCGGRGDSGQARTHSRQQLIRVSTAHNSFVGIEHLTDDELEDIRTNCERRAESEKVGEDSVKRTGEKAKKAAERVAGKWLAAVADAAL